MIDPNSPTWRAVIEWAEARIAQHQRLLETPGLPPAETELTRGALRDLRVLVGLGNPSPADRSFES